jgi:hypothetical protein
MGPLFPEHITIYAKSHLAEQINERLAWPIDILIGETTVVQSCKLKDPLTSAEKEECRWYLENFVAEAPYSTTRAQKAAKVLKSYAEVLQQDLNLLGLTPDTDCSLSNERRRLVIEVKEDPLDEKNSQNSIHQLHWELLEQPNLWTQSIVKVQVRRGIAEPPPDAAANIITTLSPREQSFNVLLVIARDTSRGLKRLEIDPNCASAILTAVQRSVNGARGSIKINLEVVRPGTLDSLEEHLARAENQHHPGYFHLVHFDLHGAVRKKRNSAVLLFSKRNSDGAVSDETTRIDAHHVAKILQRYAIRMVVLNACESARANCGDDSNVAKIFAKHGIKNIIAMSFRVLESASKVFLTSFYQGLLLDRMDFPTAASNARDMLRQQSDREARFNLKRTLLDWFIPVSYCYGPLEERLFEAQSHYIAPINSPTSQTLPMDDSTPIHANFVGRDFDILRLEKRLLGQPFENGETSAMKALYLYGVPGVGKSAFLKNLGSLWRSTSFVDAVIYIDFTVTSIRSREALLTELLAQLPHDKSTVSDAPADTVTTKGRKVLRLFQQLRFALILDGIHGLTTLEPGNRTANIATSEINKFLMELTKSQQESTNEPCGFCVIAGRSKAKPDWLDVWSSVALLELIPLEHPLSGDFLRATMLHEHADIDNNQDARGIDYFELLANLLQGIPAALLHFGNLAKIHSYPVGQLYEMLHGGYLSRELLLYSDYDLGGIFKELERNINNSPKSLLPVLITLGWYWHEGPPIHLFRKMLIEFKICLSESDIDRALELASKWGYIDLGCGDKIEWVHPLFTIYCRVLACSKDQSLPNLTTGSWASFSKSFACSVMGHVQRGPRNLVSFATESPGGLHDAVQFLTTSLSSEILRQLNFQYFRFTQTVMSGMDSPINPLFQIPLGPQNAVASPKEIRRLSERGLQNILFACKICIGGGPTALPVLLWPRLSFDFYGMSFRKVATDSEIRAISELFEQLLEKSVCHSQASRGGPFYEHRELGCILSLAGSLATIHSKYIHSPTSENQKARTFVKLGEDALHQSEGKYGIVSDPGVLLPKSILFIAKAELCLAEGNEEEADTAWAVMLESGKQAMRGFEAILSSTMIPEISATQSPRFVFDQMRAWYKSLEKVWDIFKSRVRGERFERSQMKGSSLTLHDKESSLVDLLFDLQNPDVQLGAIERALGPGGNPVTAVHYHKELIIDAMASLDTDEASNHLDAVANILSQDPSSATVVENIRIIKESYAKEGSLQQLLMSEQQPDSSSVKQTYPEMMDNELSILKRTGAPSQAIKYLETLKETFKDTDPDSFRIGLQDSETKESVQKFMQSYLPRLANERTKEKTLDMLVETALLYQGVENAEKDGDYHSTIEVIDRADRLSGPDGVPELVAMCLPQTARYRLLLASLKKVAASLKDDIAVEKVEQIRADLPHLVAELQKSAPPDSEFLSPNYFADLFRSIERTYSIRLTLEANAARQRRDHSKCFADLDKFFTLLDSGSLVFSTPEIREESISFARKTQFLARIEQAVRSKNWKSGVTCCREWEEDYKSLWEQTMDSPDGPPVRDMRDTCELSYYVSQLMASYSELNISDAFQHLEKLEALYVRQRKLPKGIERATPEITKEVLEQFEQSLRRASELVIERGFEAAKAIVSQIAAEERENHGDNFG